MVTKDASRSFIYSFGIDFKSIHWFSFMPKYFNKILLQINEWNRNKETSNKKFTWKSYFYFNIDSSFLAFCLVDFWMDFISLVDIINNEQQSTIIIVSQCCQLSQDFQYKTSSCFWISLGGLCTNFDLISTL